jgi:hypothetical protein
MVYTISNSKIIILFTLIKYLFSLIPYTSICQLDAFIVIIIISCDQFYIGYLNYVHETKQISRLHNVAAILHLQFLLHVMLFPRQNVLYFYINTFPSICAVRNTAVLLALYVIPISFNP